jgi:hypothetical protein
VPRPVGAGDRSGTRGVRRSARLPLACDEDPCRILNATDGYGSLTRIVQTGLGQWSGTRKRILTWDSWTSSRCLLGTAERIGSCKLGSEAGFPASYRHTRSVAISYFGTGVTSSKKRYFVVSHRACVCGLGTFRQ